MREYNCEYADCNELDWVTFKWIYGRDYNIPFPAVFVVINGKKYIISRFNAEENKFINYGECSPEEALNISLSIYGNYAALPELCRLANICKKMNINPENISVFKKKGIKGRASFETLYNASFLPDIILNYMINRDVPLKTIGIINKFSDKVKNFVCLWLSENSPSLSEFIKFVNEAADFKDVLERTEYSRDFRFPERLSREHREINEMMDNINKSFSPVSVKSLNNFETSDIEFSFRVKSGEDYIKICSLLLDKKSEAADIIKKIKEYD